MNYTMWEDIENKLKGGFTHEQIIQITGVDGSYIEQIENYMKEKEKRRKKSSKEILEKAIETYGADKQMNMCIEEMSELTKAICKIKRELSSGDGFTKVETLNNMYEEIADVTITLEQLKMMFTCKEEVKEQMAYKMSRLEKKLYGE
jgi:hypothetical protein